MTENTTEAKPRAPVTRYSTNSETGVITARSKDKEPETIEFGKFDEAVAFRLGMEGYIALRIRGLTHEQIAS